VRVYSTTRGTVRVVASSMCIIGGSFAAVSLNVRGD